MISDIENAVFHALKEELKLLDSLYSDFKKKERNLKKLTQKTERQKQALEQNIKSLKGEKMRMYEEYAAGTLELEVYKQKRQELDFKISELQEQIVIENEKCEQHNIDVPDTVKAAAGQAGAFLNATHLTSSMVDAFIENVFVYDGKHIVVQFKYEQSIQDAIKALQVS